MNDVRLDPRQAPARAELLLAADFGQEARGRPIHGRLESEDDGADEPGPRLKVGAVRTRRLAVSEAAARPSGSVYGNPLRGTRDTAPVVPIGAPVIVRTDIPDARGWRVYRVAPDGAVIYDGWIEHDPARAELALTELRAAAAMSPAAALRAPPGGSPATRARRRSRGGSPARRPGGRAPRRSPGRGRPADGGGAPSRGKVVAHDFEHRNQPARRGPRRPGTPRAARRQHAERRRAADDPRRPQRRPGRRRGARRVRGGAGPARESAGDLARIDGVTPGTAAVITAAVSTGTPTTTPPSRPS